MMGKLLYAALACACASLLISIIAIALPYWVYSETSFYWGPRYIALTNAFELTGLLFVASAVIFGFLVLSARFRSPSFQCIAGGLAAISGPFMILGAIIFGAMTADTHEKGATLHVGFAFSVLSGVLAVAAGVIFLGS